MAISEKEIARAKFSKAPLVGKWIFGILFCWLLLIPLFKAIIFTASYTSQQLVVTNKRVSGKVTYPDKGASKVSLDTPIGKVQNVGVTTQGLWARILHYNTIVVTSAAGSYRFAYVKDGEGLKAKIMQAVDQAEADKVADQAAQMAAAMAGALNK